MEQKSAEWFKARLGKITGSGVAALLTKSRKKDELFGETAKTYITEKVVELLTGQSKDVFENTAMRWGNDHEDEARSLYAFIHSADVKEVGFVYLDKYTGCSPDGLVGSDGLIEIKCPYNSINHYNTVVDGDVPVAYMPQVIFNMWVTNRAWCDFISYDPRFKKNSMSVIRVKMSDHIDYLENLVSRVALAREEIEKRLVEFYGV